MAKQELYTKMSAYQPRLPSMNAYDYYTAAGRKLESPVNMTSNQPPLREEVLWVKSNQSAFNLLQQGYSKSYWWPFSKLDKTFGFDELARWRNLARLINARIRWAIATQDGMDAVCDWRIGFKMARDIQGDWIILYLVGVAIEGLVHAPIIRELDFFSARECRELARTLIDSECTPDRMGTLVENEMASALQIIDQLLPEWKAYAPDFAALDEYLDGQELEPAMQQNRASLKRQVQQLQKNPTAYRQLRHEVRREICRLFQTFADALALQGGRYRPMPTKEYDPNTVFGNLLGVTPPALPQIAELYWRTRTRRRLMIAHLLLREYRLREGRYPASIEALNLKELTIDPFSGRPFVYRLTGERYLLYSVGVDGKDDGGHNPARQPHSEPPRDLFLIESGWR